MAAEGRPGGAGFEAAAESLFAFNAQAYPRLYAGGVGRRRPDEEGEGGGVRASTTLPSMAMLAKMAQQEERFTPTLNGALELEGDLAPQQGLGAPGFLGDMRGGRDGSGGFGDAHGGFGGGGGYGLIGSAGSTAAGYRGGGVPASLSLNYLLQGSDLPLGGDAFTPGLRERSGLRASEFHGLPSWEDQTQPFGGQRPGAQGAAEERDIGQSHSCGRLSDGSSAGSHRSRAGAPLPHRAGAPLLPDMSELRLDAQERPHGRPYAEPPHGRQHRPPPQARANGRAEHGGGGGEDGGGRRRQGQPQQPQQPQPQLGGYDYGQQVAQAQMLAAMGMGGGIAHLGGGSAGGPGLGLPLGYSQGAYAQPYGGMAHNGMAHSGMAHHAAAYGMGAAGENGARQGCAQAAGYGGMGGGGLQGQMGLGGMGGVGLGGMGGGMVPVGMGLGGMQGMAMGIPMAMGGMAAMQGMPLMYFNPQLGAYLPAQYPHHAAAYAHQLGGGGNGGGGGHGGGHKGRRARGSGSDSESSGDEKPRGGARGGGGRRGGEGEGRDGRERGHGGGGRGAEGREGREGRARRLMVGGREVTTLAEAAALNGLSELAHDQHGCRFLQEQLEAAPATALPLLLPALLPELPDLMVDPFANYLCQKLAQHASEEQQLQLVQRLAPSLPDISLNVHGTRAVQRLLECLRCSEAEALVASSLSGRIEELMLDLHANHVVQRCVGTLRAGHNAFVLGAVRRQFVRAATHRHGCCVLQRCLDSAEGAERSALLDLVAEHTRALITDQFGNYVVQYVLTAGADGMARRVVRAIRGCVADLACEKFSSNVIEKCLTAADAESCGLVVSELLEPAALGRLLHDPYGNYVIQRVLQVGSSAELSLLHERLGTHLPSLRNTLYGKRIQAKLQRLFPHGAPARSAS